MNNIKTNTQLYLPERNSDIRNKSTQNKNTAATNKNSPAGVQKTNPKNLITVKQKAKIPPKMNSIEQTFSEITNKFFKESNIRVEDSSLMNLDRNQKIYHITRPYKTRDNKGNPIYHEELLMSINYKNGHISNISFNGKDNIDPNAYDYKLIFNGKDPAKIYTNNILHPQVKGTVSPEIINKIDQRLKSLIKK